MRSMQLGLPLKQFSSFIKCLRASLKVSLKVSLKGYKFLSSGDILKFLKQYCVFITN